MARGEPKPHMLRMVLVLAGCAAGPTLQRAGLLALGASRHQPQPSQPLELTSDPEPLAGMQRAALHQQPAPARHPADHRHGGLHPPHPPHELHGRPSAPPAGTAALRLRRWGRRYRRRKWWWGNGRRTDATRNRAALAAGDVRPGSAPQGAADVLEQQQQVQGIGG
jgi:hypothetical protein